jgi:hypothetical protein
MKKRFSSLHFSDVAAWLAAIGVYTCLAFAGMALSLLRKTGARELASARPEPANGV